jgi:hypothetical protein
VFLSVLALCLITSPAYAWNRAGHTMTAEIAFELLNEEQQQYVVEILNAHPRFRQDFAAAMPKEIQSGSGREKALWLFQRASIWPDLVRHIGQADRTRYHRSAWHFINLPVFLTEEDEKVLAGELDDNVQMQFDAPLRQNLNLVQALKGNLLVWRDETAPDAEKAIALCWILHLTGDLHQPLHNVALYSRAYFPHGDYGGNLIAVRRKDEVTNLHVVWDGLTYRFDDLLSDKNTKELLSNDAVQMHSINAWASRDHKLAMEYVYSDDVRRELLHKISNKRNPEISLTDEYLVTATRVAKSQIIIAGHRIAALIRSD